jgi:hypothetical protein
VRGQGAAREVAAGASAGALDGDVGGVGGDRVQVDRGCDGAGAGPAQVDVEGVSGGELDIGAWASTKKSWGSAATSVQPPR